MKVVECYRGVQSSAYQAVRKVMGLKVVAAMSCALLLGAASVVSADGYKAGAPAQNADEIRPILIGQEMPKITLTTPEGKPFDLNKAMAQKPTLLVFYRGGWCPYCNLHLAALRKVEKPLKELGFQIIAVSPDKPEELTKTDEKHSLGYTLLSDSHATAIKALGLAFEVDAVTRVKYKTYGIDLEKSSGQDHHLLPAPAALLVNKDGLVTFSFISPNYKVRVDNELIMAAAKALK
ncbi:peroxiredoxin-like family protein [Marinagarivorans algicola]|uniref:peroxiredoxin-like family protein n=1 Tax=Marinagarivorans algicola TaxID=1513270 RepID=UPI0006B5996D|nr:peroxiredoxin-like family protein [Marinagarivorans algicola]